ncbi:hypothetical protein [Halobacillus andaensis]|uniref:hypothetical protein n=1 Tax=Halobacillus andaensis TaxID=1176239 RepID=UPI003D733BB9
MDWKSRYAQLQKEEPFELSEIENLISKVVDSINTELENKNVNKKVEYLSENKVIKFPDCSITYRKSSTSNSVEFHKHPINNESRIEKTINLNFTQDGYYKTNLFSENFDEINEYLIETIIENLLFSVRK